MKMQAITRSVRVSPRKVRLVSEAVKNMKVEEALNVLSLLHKRGAGPIYKTVKSAISNSLQDKNVEEKKLFIKNIEITEGPFLKRFHPSTRGRVHPYKKRSSHIKIVLEVKNGKES